MRQLPALSATPGDEDSSTEDEDEPAPRRRRKVLKSGMDRTGATTILKKITWPHELTAPGPVFSHLITCPSWNLLGAGIFFVFNLDFVCPRYASLFFSSPRSLPYCRLVYVLFCFVYHCSHLIHLSHCPVSSSYISLLYLI